MNMFMFHASRLVTRVVAKVFLGYRTRGREHLPKTGPVLIVANHASFLDPALLGTSSPRIIRFLARATLAKHRLLGWWMRSVGTLLIDRDAPSHRALEAGIEVLRAGGTFAVFPEGTRSATGAVGEFKRGMLLLLKQSGATVIPCGIAGTFACWPRDRKFPRLRHACEVRFGAPMNAELVLATGGLEELRARIAVLAGAPLLELSSKSLDRASAASSDPTRSSSSVPGAVPGKECPTPGQLGASLSASRQPDADLSVSRQPDADLSASRQTEQQPDGPVALSSRLQPEGVRPVS